MGDDEMKMKNLETSASFGGIKKNDNFQMQ